MCLAAQGRDVIVLERERHPRFAIGESSTPLANLVLEDIIRTYSLEALLPLCRYGTWKQSYPKVRCGPKRGFSFFAHEPGRPFEVFSDHRTELLVAADADKDQSYFLASVRQAALRRVLFPLGELTKPEVRSWSVICSQPL